MVTVVLRSECHVSDCPTRIVVQWGSNEMHPRSTSRMLSPPEALGAGFTAGFSAGFSGTFSADLVFSVDFVFSAVFDFSVDFDFSPDFAEVFEADSVALAPFAPPPEGVVAFSGAPAFSAPAVAGPFAFEPQPAAMIVRHRTSPSTTPPRTMPSACRDPACELRLDAMSALLAWVGSPLSAGPGAYNAGTGRRRRGPRPRPPGTVTRPRAAPRAGPCRSSPWARAGSPSRTCDPR